MGPFSRWGQAAPSFLRSFSGKRPSRQRRNIMKKEELLLEYLKTVCPGRSRVQKSIQLERSLQTSGDGLRGLVQFRQLPGDLNGSHKTASFPFSLRRSGQMRHSRTSPERPNRDIVTGGGQRPPPAFARKYFCACCASRLLTGAAGARPEAPGWPEPAWPERTGSGCCSWCRPSFPRRYRCRGWWTRHPVCSRS